MIIPKFDEARLDNLEPDMQFAVQQHDNIHTDLAGAFRQLDLDGAMALLDLLTDIVDTTRLSLVYGETNLHQEVIATAQLIGTHLNPDAQIRSDLERIVQTRLGKIDMKNRGPVGDIVYLGSTAVEAA